MSRRPLLLTATVVSLTFGSLSADAAMPVGGFAAIDTSSAIVQVQATTATEPAAAAPTGRKRAKRTVSRQKEIDSSVESGTVPKRYRTSIPKQYQDLIPWSK